MWIKKKTIPMVMKVVMEYPNNVTQEGTDHNQLIPQTEETYGELPPGTRLLQWVQFPLPGKKEI